jgi:hypothetical protein
MKSPTSTGASENSIIHNGSRLNENLINMDHEPGHASLADAQLCNLPLAFNLKAPRKSKKLT